MGQPAQRGAQVGDTGANSGIGRFGIQTGCRQQHRHDREACDVEKEETPHGADDGVRSFLPTYFYRDNGVRVNQPLDFPDRLPVEQDDPDKLSYRLPYCRHSRR